MTTAAQTARPSSLMMIGLVAGPILSMIDSSVVNLAVPDLVRELGQPLATVQWTISGYLLAMAVGLAVTPYLGRRFGLLPTYVASLVLFTLASLACAFAPDAAVLIGCRALQGLAGAPMVPLAIGLLIGQGGAAEDRTNIPMSTGLAFFAAPALGVSAGGLLISWYGWRSIFLVNVVVALLALPGALAARRAGLGSQADRAARLDLPGLALLAAGLGTVTYGVEQATTHGWGNPWWPMGLAFLGGYILWARRHSHPALDLDLARDKVRALALAVCVLSSVVLYAVLFLAPVYLQSIQHRPTSVAGLALLAPGLVMGVSSPLGDKVVERYSVRAAVVAGMLLLAVMTAAMIGLDATTPVWITTLLLCGRGMAIGLTAQPLVLSLLGGLAPERAADGNTLFSVAQRLAGSFGIALLATYFAARTAASGSPLTALHESVLVLAVVALLGAVAAARIAAPKAA